MVLVGKSEDNANVLLSDIQAELQYNQRYIADFGQQYNTGSWQTGEFVTRHTAFFSRSDNRHEVCDATHSVDYIVIDDGHDELCQNEKESTD